jgi:O-antigen/teichoic acid export membrane protein
MGMGLMNLRKHATSLAVMHIVEVLQPLLILPYAGRMLGPVEFGHYAYAVSIGQFAVTIVDYGFHWTGQRAASVLRKDSAGVASLFADVIATKMVLCLMVTAAGLLTADRFLAIGRSMFLCAILSALGGIVFPAWLFIALERAWQAAIAVVIARAAALVAFLAVVTSPDRVEAAVAIQSAIPLVSGLISVPFLLSVGFRGFATVTPSRIADQFRNGWRGFLYTLVERALMTIPVPLVEHLAGYVAAGQYAVAEKFVAATRPFFRVVAETFAPRAAYYAKHDVVAGLALIRRALATTIVGAALGVFLFFFAPMVIILLFGENFSGAIPIVRTMAILPVLMNVNVCTSNLYMFNYGHERAWACLTVFGLLVFLAGAYGLSPYFSNAAIGVATAAISRECVVLAFSATFFVVYGTRKLKRQDQALGLSGATRTSPEAVPASLSERQALP